MIELYHPTNIERPDPFSVGTVVRIRKTGQFALITSFFYLKNKKDFLHYLGKIEGRGEGEYALYHQDLELECLPEN
jgi:hypothetical protein